MSDNVRRLLDQIEQLPDADRAVLNERLAELAATNWKREAEQAREIARQRGIDQATIDEAIDKLRYRS